MKQPRHSRVATVVSLWCGSSRRWKKVDCDTLKRNWNQRTIRKRMHELKGSTCFEDIFAACGRKCDEEHLPNLLGDIKTIENVQSQVDPTFKTTPIHPFERG